MKNISYMKICTLLVTKPYSQLINVFLFSIFLRSYYAFCEWWSSPIVIIASSLISEPSSTYIKYGEDKGSVHYPAIVTSMSECLLTFPNDETTQILINQILNDFDYDSFLINFCQGIKPCKDQISFTKYAIGYLNENLPREVLETHNIKLFLNHIAETISLVNLTNIKLYSNIETAITIYYDFYVTDDLNNIEKFTQEFAMLYYKNINLHQLPVYSNNACMSSLDPEKMNDVLEHLKEYASTQTDSTRQKFTLGSMRRDPADDDSVTLL